MRRRDGRFRRRFRRKKLNRIESDSAPLFDHQSLLQSVEPESQLDELSQSLSESVVE